MPDDPEATWPSLLDEQHRELGISEARRSVTNESAFRDAFEDLCDQYGELYHQRQLASLTIPYKSITAFTKAIDSSASLQSPETLTSLLWAATFRVVEIVLSAEIGLTGVVDCMRKLNKGFPNFGANLTRYPQDDSVQIHLRRIFSTYIACFEEMISYFATNPSRMFHDIVPVALADCIALEYIQINTSIDTATGIILEAKLQWERALSAAADLEEKQRLLTASVPPSLPNGFDGESIIPHPVNVHFEVVRHLGDGTHGRVSEVKESSTGQVYARKLVSAQQGTRLRELTERRVIEEVSIMHKLRHHHIASCLFWTRERGYFSIVMLPVAEYDLRHFLEEECVQKQFPKSTIRQLDNWFGCLVSALTYAHNLEIEHKDIKLSNILIKNEQPYLADFGSATDFSELEGSTMTDNMFAGTPVYYAPEARPWGRAADVFALGCVFSEMITVRFSKSLQDYRDYRFVQNIDNGFAFRSNLPKVREWLRALPTDDADDEALELVLEQTLKMLDEDNERRPKAKIIKKRLRAQGETLFCDNC